MAGQRDGSVGRNEAPPPGTRDLALEILTVVGVAAGIAAVLFVATVASSMFGSGLGLVLLGGAGCAAAVSALLARWRRGPLVVGVLAVTAYLAVAVLLGGWALSCTDCYDHGADFSRMTYAIFGLTLLSIVLGGALAAVAVGGVIGRFFWSRTP